MIKYKDIKRVLSGHVVTLSPVEVNNQDEFDELYVTKIEPKIGGYVEITLERRSFSEWV